MHGILQKIGIDDNGNPTYGVSLLRVIFPVNQRDVGIRNITDGLEVEFAIDRKTGEANLGHPLPVRGCEMEPTSS